MSRATGTRASSGGPAGDLYVGLAVQESPAFERRGQDLFTVLDISMTQATLGADVEVEALEAHERIRVEAGTESGTVIRLKSKGVPNVNRRGRGDLFITLHVVTPGELSKEERGLWERLAEPARRSHLEARPRAGRPAAPGVLSAGVLSR